MKQIAPGVYDDERGGLHLDAAELLAANGFAVTPANVERLAAEARRMMRDIYGDDVHVTVTLDPITE
jgi:hypothetical protein